MSIAKQIFVRYRAEGHLRFAIPQELCQLQVAQQLEKELKQAEGIYRVDLHRRQKKLSVRYIEGVTHFQAVARALCEAVNKIEMQSSCCASSIAMAEEVLDEAEGWLKSKYQEAKETITALGIVTRGAGNAEPLLLTAEKEKFAIEFFTDILVLYLIKLHWHLIIGHWIRSPWQYRSEWMATIYMIFLLVRSKKPKK
ncbi:MAG: cation transporter [Candidatus Methylumidiphilus sp.]